MNESETWIRRGRDVDAEVAEYGYVRRSMLRASSEVFWEIVSERDLKVLRILLDHRALDFLVLCLYHVFGARGQETD